MKSNGLNGWSKGILIAVVAGGGGLGGSKLIGSNGHNGHVSPEAWTNLSVKVARIEEKVDGQTKAIGKLEETVKELVRLIPKP